MIMMILLLAVNYLAVYVDVRLPCGERVLQDLSSLLQLSAAFQTFKYSQATTVHNASKLTSIAVQYSTVQYSKVQYSKVQ